MSKNNDHFYRILLLPFTTADVVNSTQATNRVTRFPNPLIDEGQLFYEAILLSSIIRNLTLISRKGNEKNQ